MNFAEFVQKLPGLGDLNIGERFLLSILVWHCGTNGHCWPTVETLTKEMGGGRKTTFRLLNNLEAKGYISRGKKDGNRNVYGVKKTPCQNDTSVKKGSTQNDTQGCQKGDDSLKEKEKKEKNSSPTPPQGEKTKKLPLVKKREELQTVLSNYDIEPLKLEFESQGLDVDKWWTNVQDYVLNGSAEKPFPNPSKWRDWTKAFRKSCQGAIEKGLFIRKVIENPSPTMPDHPLWPEIQALRSYDFQVLRKEAQVYSRRESQCGDKRDPPEEVTRGYMIKIYEAEKGKIPEPP